MVLCDHGSPQLHSQTVKMTCRRDRAFPVAFALVNLNQEPERRLPETVVGAQFQQQILGTIKQSGLKVIVCELKKYLTLLI